MKVFTLLPFILVIALDASSQINLQAFDNERDGITKKGMLVLGSWGTANIIVGPSGNRLQTAR